ncbi:MAG: Glutamyl-tRNA(Gln) amidotransferase subunit E [Candidatus Argoarchaeum ethanivorans]|uniref:Glutamyl-tRNA(Gln) amidotransferase subunit E n=1 Tax=Candidatus Argoarchaeum ethanivorans TaxID=2608793 RepID=A0A811T8X1_9EURY|nr:MAG: Glutamyl-tRNA(Gln) amidotransferase subunit E [Candidatus Argoarchaeum ethanivorans]
MNDHFPELKCGIEIHQQLNTKEKLFCKCPTRRRDTVESNLEFHRFLRATTSEMGEIDRAALEETKIQKKYIYKAYDSTCLVENDEEPPGKLNMDALDIALTMSKMLHMHPVDELHSMRKIVVDGSNTAGFQRTGLVATDGYIDAGGRVGISVICLEEEAAQKIEDSGESVIYSLDRLGIPLVEICTAPDIKTPGQARDVAAYIGMLLRSTGRVKRGLGTIRQDVNISTKEGARVEIKGVQELDLLPLILEQEVQRQANLIDIKNELNERGAAIDGIITDVTDLFKNTDSAILKRALDNGAILAVKLKRFAGIVGREIQPDRRLGTEFSDRAKKSGVGGIFHTDELPNYGITKSDVNELKKTLNADEKDCIVIVADRINRARGALESVIIRAQEALVCVPEETRRMLPDGTSAYMRPLPGAARMYPETDVLPVPITQEHLEKIKLPELLTIKKERFRKQYNLNDELANLISQSENACLFEQIMKAVPGAKPTIVIKALHTTIGELQKEGYNTHGITLDHLVDLFNFSAEGNIPNEAIKEVLKAITIHPQASLRDLLTKLRLAGSDIAGAGILIGKIVKEREEFVKERRLDAAGPLMGVVMKELRGKVGGQQISQILKRKIEEILKIK